LKRLNPPWRYSPRRTYGEGEGYLCTSEQRVDRILYFFHGRVAAVVSHGIVKQGKVPPEEIERAIQRKKRFETDPSRHSHSKEIAG